MGRIGAYITQEERLRRIGELLLKGVYLWADAVEGAAAGVKETVAVPDAGAVETDPACAGDEAQGAPRVRAAHCACGAAEHTDVLGESRPKRRQRKPRTLLRSGVAMPLPTATAENPDRTRGTG